MQDCMLLGFAADTPTVRGLSITGSGHRQHMAAGYGRAGPLRGGGALPLPEPGEEGTSWVSVSDLQQASGCGTAGSEDLD